MPGFVNVFIANVIFSIICFGMIDMSTFRLVKKNKNHPSIEEIKHRLKPQIAGITLKDVFKNKIAFREFMKHLFSEFSLD